MERQPLPLHGRGTGANPTNRFETIEYDRDEDADPDDGPGPRTTFYKDTARSLITTNDSPDIAFDASINVYRGCEHGCIYCYARPFHEFLGLSAGLDFESKIFVKEDAPKLLRRELENPRWSPKTLAMSGVTDCYQPIERRLEITRRCLEVMVEFRQAVAIVTKNRLVVRDADLLRKLADHGAASVRIGVTSLDPSLASVMEPRATTPSARLEAIRELAAAGVPVGVMVAPIIPGLNDHEVPAILEAARKAGATEANYTILRLPFGVKDLFIGWVRERFPARASKILGRIRDLRGGKLNESEFRKRMSGSGPLADVIDQVFRNHRRRLEFPGIAPLSTAAFRRPGDMPLFAEEE
jgi:DNA repair photolyase